MDDWYQPEVTISDGGFVYVSGFTSSSDFPTTPGVYGETCFGGGQDRYVCKFSADLTTLVASTFIGGSNYGVGMCGDFDSEGSVILAGYTASNDLPTSVGGYDPTHNGYQDVFVTKLTPDLSTLIASAYGRCLGRRFYVPLVKRPVPLRSKANRPNANQSSRVYCPLTAERGR